MVKIIFNLFIGCLTLFSALCSGKPYTDTEIKDRAIHDLGLARSWFIENGVSEYFKQGSDASVIQNRIRDQWAVTSFSGPVIGSDRYDVRFIIKAAGIYNEIINVHSVNDGDLYEYWVVKISGEEWAKVERSCSFLITKSNDFRSKRTVIKEESIFFDTWKVGGITSISLPLESLELKYDLAPWIYSECYENSDLTDYQVVLGVDGKYTQKKITWWERMFKLYQK